MVKSKRTRLKTVIHKIKGVNQNPQEGETTQWQKEKGGKDNDLQNSTQKIKVEQHGPH